MPVRLTVFVEGVMTLKRLILIVLTVGVVFSVGLGLWQSFSQPQFQSRLELYQTNLVLQASEWQETDPNLAASSKALLGGEPVKAGVEAYETFRRSVQKNLERAQSFTKISSPETENREVSVSKLEQLLTELDLRLGVLQTAQGKVDEAQKIWADAIQRAGSQPGLESLSKTAGVLSGLWSQPPQLFPDAESRIKKNLDGWFRFRALSQLYTLQQRQDSLNELQAEEQPLAERALKRLAIVGGIPILGCLMGVGLLLCLGGQWLIQRKQSLISPDGIPVWSVPWDAETIWQVLILGFFLVGQILFPFLLQLVQATSGFNPAALGERAKAFYILIDYILLATGGLAVLYLSIQRFFPLPEGWFRVSLRGNWLLWGFGGYFAALPLVILVSLVNQAIWKGQGGSNPILPIALEGKDNVALAVFS